MKVEIEVQAEFELDIPAQDLDAWVKNVQAEFGDVLESNGAKEVGVDVYWVDWHELEADYEGCIETDSAE